MIINIKTVNESTGYDIVIQKGCLGEANKYLNLNRKVLFVSDSGVPTKYVDTVAQFAAEPHFFRFASGEFNKSFDTFQSILEYMVKNRFTRTDCVVAVGGGVVGDLSGFAASAYMRGVDFYNIPTTLLSQVDSSIGGKTAVNFCGIKNNIGAFYQPKAVLIDPLTLETLDSRLIGEGLAEAIKMAATSDKELFDFIKNSQSLNDDIQHIITEALKIKAAVVEADPKEKGLRRVLNFGHTIGHAIESDSAGRLYHGECVAIGMLYLCSEQVRSEIAGVLRKYNLPTTYDKDIAQLADIIRLDKKMEGDTINIVYVDTIGSFEFKKMTLSRLIEGCKAGVL